MNIILLNVVLAAGATLILLVFVRWFIKKSEQRLLFESLKPGDVVLLKSEMGRQYHFDGTVLRVKSKSEVLIASENAFYGGICIQMIHPKRISTSLYNILDPQCSEEARNEGTESLKNYVARIEEDAESLTKEAREILSKLEAE